MTKEELAARIKKRMARIEKMRPKSMRKPANGRTTPEYRSVKGKLRMYLKRFRGGDYFCKDSPIATMGKIAQAEGRMLVPINKYICVLPESPDHPMLCTLGSKFCVKYRKDIDV